MEVIVLKDFRMLWPFLFTQKEFLGSNHRSLGKIGYMGDYSRGGGKGEGKGEGKGTIIIKIL